MKSIDFSFSGGFLIQVDLYGLGLDAGMDGRGGGGAHYTSGFLSLCLIQDPAEHWSLKSLLSNGSGYRFCHPLHSPSERLPKNRFPGLLVHQVLIPISTRLGPSDSSSSALSALLVSLLWSCLLPILEFLPPQQILLNHQGIHWIKGDVCVQGLSWNFPTFCVDHIHWNIWMLFHVCLLFSLDS